MLNINLTLSQQAEFAMPVSGGALAVRALPLMSVGGAVSAAASDAKLRLVDGTTVFGYGHITDVAVLKGAFPGPSAWSPPI